MPEQSSLKNRLLSRLSPADFALLSGRLEAIQYPRGTLITDFDQPIEFVTFLESGVASVVAQSPEGQRAEAGIIGREGFVHPAVVLGAASIPNEVRMQLAGEGHRLLARDLLDAAEASATLRQKLLLFSQANVVQITFTTLSNAVHQVEERLARWLLMIHDRSDSDDLALTHEFMGIMLSVRRPSVTNALHVLEGDGFIELTRGYVTVTNRSALEEFAGDAYGKAEAEYQKLFGAAL